MRVPSVSSGVTNQREVRKEIRIWENSQDGEKSVVKG